MGIAEFLESDHTPFRGFNQEGITFQFEAGRLPFMFHLFGSNGHGRVAVRLAHIVDQLRDCFQIAPVHRTQTQTRPKKRFIKFQLCIHHPFSFSPDTCKASEPILFFSIHSSRRIPMKRTSQRLPSLFNTFRTRPSWQKPAFS